MIRAQRRLQDKLRRPGKGDYTVSQFFVTDEFSAIRAGDAVVAEKPITISGTAAEGFGVLSGLCNQSRKFPPNIGE